MKSTMFRLLCGALLAAAAMFAADATGKWTGESQGPNGAMVQTFTFKQDGSKLTGKVENQMGSVDIADGKADGNNISFSVTREFNGNSMVIKYTGKVSADSIALESETPRGKRQLTLKKAN